MLGRIKVKGLLLGVGLRFFIDASRIFCTGGGGGGQAQKAPHIEIARGPHKEKKVTKRPPI